MAEVVPPGRNTMDRYSEEAMHDIRRAVEHEILRWPGVSARKMFGVPAYLTGGKMFLLLVTGGLVLTRLPSRDRDTVASRFPTLPFIGHGTVKAWVQVTVRSSDDVAALVPFLRKSYEGALGHGA